MAKPVKPIKPKNDAPKISRRGKLTVAQLLDDDTRKHIADRLASGDIKDATIIYYEGDELMYITTRRIAELYGDASMVLFGLEREWLDE